MKAGDLVRISECRALSGIAVIISQRGFDFFDIVFAKSGQKILMSRDFMTVINASR
jgi:hypothetical protein